MNKEKMKDFIYSFSPNTPSGRTQHLLIAENGTLCYKWEGGERLPNSKVLEKIFLISAEKADKVLERGGTVKITPCAGGYEDDHQAHCGCSYGEGFNEVSLRTLIETKIVT